MDRREGQSRCSRGSAGGGAERSARGRSAGPAVDVKATEEGLLISLTDEMNFSMFAIGSAEPQPQVDAA